MDLIELFNLSRNELFFKYIDTTHLYNEIDNYILLNPNFKDVYKEKNNLYEAIYTSSIYFTLEDIWKMNKEMLIYINERDEETMDLLCVNVAILLYNDDMLIEKERYIVESEDFEKIFTSMKDFKTSMIKIKYCQCNSSDSEGNILDPITGEIIDEIYPLSIDNVCYKKTRNPYFKAIKMIMKNFGELETSEYMNMNLKEIPKQLGNIVDLSGNKITNVDLKNYSIFSLCLKDNLVNTVTSMPKDCMFIDLSENCLENISFSANYMILNRNNIKKIQNLKDVCFLDLSNNKIDKIENVENVEILNLNYNNITIFPNCRNTGIKKLYLKGNKLKHLDVNYLPKNLEEIDIRENCMDEKEILFFCKKNGILIL